MGCEDDEILASSDSEDYAWLPANDLSFEISDNEVESDESELEQNESEEGSNDDADEEDGSESEEEDQEVAAPMECKNFYHNFS